MKTNKQTSGQAGFTLVEIIVTLVIFALVLTVAGSVYFYGVRMYTQTEVKNTEKYVGDNVYKYMQQKITYATKLAVRPDRSDDKTYQKYITNMKDNTRVSDAASGYLHFGDYTNNIEENTLGEKFYGNYTIKYQVTLPLATKDTDKDIAVENLLDLTVLVLNQDGQEVYKTEGRIKNLNCTLTVKGNRGEAYTNPLIVYNETAEQEIDPAMAIANQLRTDYINLYERLYDCVASKFKTDQEKAAYMDAVYPGYSTVVGKYYMNNDLIQKYLFNVTYKEAWPTYPAQNSTKSEFAYVNKYFDDYPSSSSPQLYMRLYCGGTAMDGEDRDFAKNNCYVFVAPQNNTTTWYNWFFIYDCLESQVYVSTNGRNTKLTGTNTIMNQTWNNALNALKTNGNWQLFEK